MSEAYPLTAELRRIMRGAGVGYADGYALGAEGGKRVNLANVTVVTGGDRSIEFVEEYGELSANGLAPGEAYVAAMAMLARPKTDDV